MNTSSDANIFLPTLYPEGSPAYLTLGLKEQHILQLVSAAIAGMVAWDLALDAYNIYRLFFESRPSIPSVVYVFSRISTLSCTILYPPLLIVSGDCKHLFLAHSIAWALASSLTSMLFLFRIWALFWGRITIIAFFTLLWLCVVGGSTTMYFSARDTSAAHLPNSSPCLAASALPTFVRVPVGLIIQAIFDALVFIAISLWLLPHYEVDLNITWKEWMMSFFYGKNLPRLSKAFLQGGQQYYLISVVANTIALAIYFAPSVPSPYHPIAAHILISLINSVACKIYCDLRFRRAQASDSTLLSNIVFPHPNGDASSTPPLFRTAQAMILPEAITSTQTTHPTVTTDIEELEVIIVTKHRRSNFANSDQT